MLQNASSRRAACTIMVLFLVMSASSRAHPVTGIQNAPSTTTRKDVGADLICLPDKKILDETLQQIFKSLLRLHLSETDAVKKVKTIAQEFQANQIEGKYCVSRNTLDKALPMALLANSANTEAQKINDTSRFELETTQRTPFPPGWPAECTPPETNEWTCFFFPPTKIYGVCSCHVYWWLADYLYLDCHSYYMELGHCITSQWYD